MKYAGTKGLIVRKTYPELLSNHIRQFFIEYPETVNWYKVAEKAIYWPNGSITEFSHLSRADDVYTYQGREYQDISIDEITQHEEVVFKILRSSLRTTDPRIEPRMLLTGNPGGIGHLWVKRIFIDKDFKPEENPKDFGFVQASVWDNKALMNADPDYVKRLQDLPEDKRKAYLEGDWNIFAGQYYGEFKEKKHVIKYYFPFKSNVIVGGLDWGRTNPFSNHLTEIKTVEFKEKKFFRATTFMEVYGVDKMPKEWGEIIKQKVSNYNIGLEDISWIRCDNQI